MNDDHKYVARRSELARGVEPYARIDDGRAASLVFQDEASASASTSATRLRARDREGASTHAFTAFENRVRMPSQHTPKTPWKEEVVSFSLDGDARRRRREANARRRPDGTATNA